MTDLLAQNLLSPLALAFALGFAAKRLRSDLALPKDAYSALSIYLLFAIGLKGGVELSRTPLDQLAGPALATVLIGCVTPVGAYLLLRRWVRLGSTDAAAVAAHYGSVSAVTFIAAQQFVAAAGAPAEGFMTGLLALMESPGIAVALGIAAWTARREAAARTSRRVAPALDERGGVYAMGADAAAAPTGFGAAIHEVLAGKTMVLLLGGLAIGAAVGAEGWEPVRPFFEGGFKGALCLFLLELGVLAGSRSADLRTAGPRLAAFAIAVPLAHGALGVALGTWAGLSVGGAAVLGTMAASASYIAAPAAVRAALPEASPALYLTSSLAVTFPFNLVVGIPLFFALARALGG